MKPLRKADLKAFLDEKYILYNRASFIASDPISIPHQFSIKQDIEIASFMAATIAWGQRPTILRNASRLMEWMDNSPHAFIIGHKPTELIPFKKFVHRTFNGVDCTYFIRALKQIYAKYDSLEDTFLTKESWNEADTLEAIVRFRTEFFSLAPPDRSRKHVSDPSSGSAAKRINM
jgi:uncharacterized protein (TIGR02757 family)